MQLRLSRWLVPVVLLLGLGGAVLYWNRPSPSAPEPAPHPPNVQHSTTAQPSGAPWFRDVTASSGLSFTYRNGEEADQYTLLETLGGGVALLDYDGDGLLDVFLPGGGSFAGPKKETLVGHPCKLFRNLGGWKFQDVTHEVGLDAPNWWYTHGAAVADFDRDGRPDLLVTGYGKLALFRNVDGKRFLDVSAQLGLQDSSWSTSAGWADLDGDGFPDLYVCHYVDWSFANHPRCKGYRVGVERDICSPEHFRPLKHSLFRNEAGKKFRDVADEQGFKAAGCGLGVLWLDVNDDRRPDAYVANDTNHNFLFLNRGGQLAEKGFLAGVAVDENGRPNGSMGVDAADVDGIGRPWLFVTNFHGELHALYQNAGNERFFYQSSATGLAALGNQLVGFGTAFLDGDSDGWEDLIFANGHVFRSPPGNKTKQRTVLLRNVELGRRRFFKDISADAGAYFQTVGLGRGLAVGDLDNDGRPDVVVGHTNSPVVLLRNETPPAHWLGLELVGKERRDVVGSTVIVETSLRRLTRFVKGGGSYLSANDPRLLFGLGAEDKVKQVTVKWAWGEVQTWHDVKPDRHYRLLEGVADVQPSRTTTSENQP